MEELVPRDDAEYAEYFTIVGIDPKYVVARLEEREGIEVKLLVQHDDGGLFEFVVGEDCPVALLCLAGAVPRHVESTEGRGRITAEILSAADPASVIDRFRSAYSDAELVIKRHQPHRTPRFSVHEFPPDVAGLLTKRQHEVSVDAFERVLRLAPQNHRRGTRRIGRDISVDVPPAPPGR